MFTRARLHLTLAYAALLGVTVVLVAGAIGLFAVQEARRTDDRELQIRAAAVAAALPPAPPFSMNRPPEGDRGLGYGPPFPPRLEEQGLLDYFMPVDNGRVVPPPFSTLPGLPDVAAAQQAVATRTGQYQTAAVEGNQVRLYSLPVLRNGQVAGVVQAARSRYFVNAAVTRLALIALVAGGLGLLLSAGAGYWLAGRTLTPIAVALDRQRNFAADASHELRTPLTVLLTNAELLTLHPERRLADYQEVVADMVAEIQRLSRLVTGLLTLARADQGAAVLTRTSIDLADVAFTVTRQFAGVAAGKGLDLRAEIEPGVAVSGDRDRLLQLAVILVDNAVRYTRDGSVTVRVARRGNEALLAVADTGPGIAPEHLPHLFERFYRTDAARSDEGGTGLGLALAQWIVDSHHGQIDLTSTVGGGSTFTVLLPAARASDGGRPAGLPAAAPTGRASESLSGHPR